MKPIRMIDPEYEKAILKEAKEMINVLNGKSKLSLKNKLFREHLITLTDNPSPANVILFLSGRLEDLKRR